MPYVMPHVEVRSRRVGGATFQIQCKSSRQKNFYGYEMVNSLFKKKTKINGSKISNECLAAAKEEGAAVKKRMDTHKMAEANRLSLTLDFNS
jgi:small subunit ribosomal protein S7